MNKPKVTQAVRDIIWMARRYADGRQTYATQMFNDSYDILREELGDEIERKDAKHDEFENYPYATDGGGDMFNRDLKERRFYAKKDSK